MVAGSPSPLVVSQRLFRSSASSCRPSSGPLVPRARRRAVDGELVPLHDVHSFRAARSCQSVFRPLRRPWAVARRLCIAGATACSCGRAWVQRVASCAAACPAFPSATLDAAGGRVSEACECCGAPCAAVLCRSSVRRSASSAHVFSWRRRKRNIVTLRTRSAGPPCPSSHLDVPVRPRGCVVFCTAHQFGRSWVTVATWLILPVVICLSQRLSHACLSISTYTVKLRMAH